MPHPPTKKKSKVSFKILEQMLLAQNDLKLCADFFKVSVDQLKRAIKKRTGIDPAEYCEMVRNRGVAMARAVYYEQAFVTVKDDKRQKFWLKNFGGMVDKQDLSVEGSGLTINYGVPDNGTGPEGQALTPPSRPTDPIP